MADHLAPHLDLSKCPLIFVSATHFGSDELQTFEEELVLSRAALTYDILEAGIVISKVVRKARITLDLRAKGLETEPHEYQGGEPHTPSSEPWETQRGEYTLAGTSSSDAIIVDDSSTASETDIESHQRTQRRALKISGPTREQTRVAAVREPGQSEAGVTVVSTAWYYDSKALGEVQPLEQYTNYRGRPVQRSAPTDDTSISNHATRSSASETKAAATPKVATGDQILERAKEDTPTPSRKRDRFGRRKFGLSAPSANPSSWEAGHGTVASSSSSSRPARLLRQTTTEEDDGYARDLPAMPAWVQQRVKYACQRATPAASPNDAFVAQLLKIRLARLLTNDDVGVRAYSTAIAALAAYPERIRDAREVLALPGCDAKIANLFAEWAGTGGGGGDDSGGGGGTIRAVAELEADADLRVLRTFYDIWGVGATTAREFYYDKGWRDLDDVVEHGWAALSRVQQIGVKFYDEFQDPIPRAEVERIGRVVHAHAVRVRDAAIQTMIVGGYRRGKDASGDVDIIVSHPIEGRTLNIINDIVASLEDEEWITHTLYISLNSSHRDQATLPFRAGGGGGHGFDTLDKALVVWQDPAWPSREQDLAENLHAKNPNVHRRVDIIISPWRTVGCAVLGWSGGTTFQRDLRRYAKHAKSWKFDSSGVRDRRNGEVVDVEGYFEWKGKQGVEARAKTMEEAERRVFESMGIEYRQPWERCTY